MYYKRNVPEVQPLEKRDDRLGMVIVGVPGAIRRLVGAAEAREIGDDAAVPPLDQGPMTLRHRYGHVGSPCSIKMGAAEGSPSST